jgi:3-oxoacyl-[acyl-carrier-protein] synthase-3
MKNAAFITGFGVCLPNAPVGNDEIENVLGRLGSMSSRVKLRALGNNGITSRHYAIDPITGRQTHTQARLTVDAIRALAGNCNFPLDNLECLACGTSAGDQVIPSHGSMVHAELGGPACEVVTTAGVCCAGMSALKYCFLNVAAGNCRNAVATASELASPTLTAKHFQAGLARVESGALPFDSEFLRWMLSDGAGAMLITPAPRSGGASLRIDWLDILSYAHQTDVCMHFGLRKHKDGSLTGYRNVADPAELCSGYLNLAQDVGILKDRMPVLLRAALDTVKSKRGLDARQIDWFLPHYSSEWLRRPFSEILAEKGLEIPNEKWFTNLTRKGNTGSAAIYIILDELASSGRLKGGQRLLCFVPESARMTFAFMHLTVV